MKRLTPFEFIEKANLVHGNRYGYSKIGHVYSSEKVTITCPTHGDFEQRPNNHLRGQGCIACNLSKKLFPEEFIERAIQKHGDKRYNYDKVKYFDNHTKVIITCPTHGDFEQTPKAHLRGNGCPNCFGTKKSSTKEFIEKAKQKHGDNKYNYDRVKYLGIHTKVTITCLTHGDFEQTPISHLQGRGCTKCGGTSKSSTEEFIKKAKQKHGDYRYNYDKVKYINADTKITITCPAHGDFEQRPSSHLHGYGCAKCAHFLTTEEFIGKAKKEHGDNRYNYDKVHYIDQRTKVTITCPIHGDFEQTPVKHLMGRGCTKCSGGIKYSTEEFIAKAKQKHGDSRYNYDKVKYINTNTKVIITCIYHGDFKQAPNSHIQGQGCSKCKIPKGEKKVEDFLIGRKIKYEWQYSFEDCIATRKLSFDFAIFINDKIGLIEYQGEQHYFQIGFGKDTANSTLEKNIRHDKIKEDYAKDNEIPLLLIPYTEFDNIEKVVEDFIKSLTI
ncbi:MAG TPA: DUF723 domain-containing protein [Bacteroidia bacterium]|nr:DUF723 domain-containing protein [Bacteroidia bacterium]